MRNLQTTSVVNVYYQKKRHFYQKFVYNITNVLGTLRKAFSKITITPELPGKHNNTTAVIYFPNSTLTFLYYTMPISKVNICAVNVGILYFTISFIIFNTLNSQTSPLYYSSRLEWAPATTA